MTARDYALAMLDKTPLPGWQAHLLRRRATPPDDPRELALAEQIRVGVIKNHALLEHLINHYARRPGRIEPLVRKILAMALYQIRLLTRIPPSAAVDEAVSQSRRFGKPHASGFVNALLRRAVRELDVPLPSRESDPLRYAEIVLSHPRELLDRLVDAVGLERAIRICEHNNREPPTLVRVFRGQQLPQMEGITPHEKPGIFVVDGAKRATFADWAGRGLAQVQDATAAGVLDHLDLKPGQDVLDRCAGLGTKTLQIHDAIGSDGWIMAVDPAAQRCLALRQLLAKRKIENVAVVQSGMLGVIPQLKRTAFDRILVDAPCSNSGVLARRPEARYAQTAAALASLAELQDQILDDSAAYLREGGRLVYSTCSIWAEENQHRVERFLKAHRAFSLLGEPLLTYPSAESDPTRYHDGGFVAVLVRR